MAKSWRDHIHPLGTEMEKPQDPNKSRFQKIEFDYHPTPKRFIESYTRHFSFHSFIDLFRSTFQISTWLPKYSIKNQLLGDLYAGIMLSCSNIPLGIACSTLAGVPEINGLYTILLSSLIYPIFSGWPHGTMGPYAAIDISTGVHTNIILENYYSTLGNSTSIDDIDDIVNPSTVTSTLVFLNGIICLIFGILRLDFITEYFSEPLVGGFSTGIALYVVVSQLRPILGLPKPSMKKLGFQFPNLILMAQKLEETNLIALSLSIVSILFLLTCKCGIQPIMNRLCSKRCIAVPWEFILLVLGIVVSASFDFANNHEVYIIGEMPNKLPELQMPLFWMTPIIIWRSIAISIVQMCIHMFGVRVLSRRMGYRVERTQEIYAIGGTLLLSAFFPVYSANNSIGASTLIQESGGTTQMACIFSGLIILVVILTCSSLFSILPSSVMGVIVLMVVGKQLNGVTQLPHLWKTSKWDLTVWMASFFASVMYGITYGLGIGMVFQLFTVVARTQWPKWTVWYSQPPSEKSKELFDICIFEFESMLLFTNCERFVHAVQNAISKWTMSEKPRNRLFIFDFTAMTEVDAVGLVYLKELLKELQSKSTVFFVRPRLFLIKTLRNEGIQICDFHICDTAEEAVNRAELKLLTHNVVNILEKS